MVPTCKAATILPEPLVFDNNSSFGQNAAQAVRPASILFLDRLTSLGEDKAIFTLLPTNSSHILSHASLFNHWLNSICWRDHHFRPRTTKVAHNQLLCGSSFSTNSLSFVSPPPQSSLHGCIQPLRSTVNLSPNRRLSPLPKICRWALILSLHVSILSQTSILTYINFMQGTSLCLCHYHHLTVASSHRTSAGEPPIATIDRGFTIDN